MATFIKHVQPIDDRKNAMIEFTPHEMDILLDICRRIGGSVKQGQPHHFMEMILKPILEEAGAVRKNFTLAGAEYGKSIYYQLDNQL